MLSHKTPYRVIYGDIDNILSRDELTLHATGSTRHAFVNTEGRVVRPPQFMRELIRRQIDPEPC